jgi:GxxExxY protein
MINADKNFLHADITDKIIGCAYKVYHILGAGFLEKIYENALLIELHQIGLNVVQQHPIKVNYKGNIIGDYYADLLVENRVIIELKAVSELSKVNETQLVNYLKATGVEVGLLINFGEDISIKRKVMQDRAEHQNYK